MNILVSGTKDGQHKTVIISVDHEGEVSCRPVDCLDGLHLVNGCGVDGKALL
jgi:hypothetical protein